MNSVQSSVFKRHAPLPAISLHKGSPEEKLTWEKLEHLSSTLSLSFSVSLCMIQLSVLCVGIVELVYMWMWGPSDRGWDYSANCDSVFQMWYSAVGG